MPKTTFTDGVTAVAAAFLNKIFSHVHDGADEDGSAAKVDFSDHIDYGDQGQLSVTNDDAGLHEITHSGSALFKRFVTGVLSANWLEVASSLTGSSPTAGEVLVHEGNTPKVIAKVQLSTDGSGGLSITSSTGYNIGAVNIATGRVVITADEPGGGLDPGLVIANLHSQNLHYLTAVVIGGVNLGAGSFGIQPGIQVGTSIVPLNTYGSAEDFTLDVVVY